MPGGENRASRLRPPVFRSGHALPFGRAPACQNILPYPHRRENRQFPRPATTARSCGQQPTATTCATQCAPASRPGGQAQQERRMPSRSADALLGGGRQRPTEEHPMSGIGTVGPWLERHSSPFTVAALAKELAPAWVDQTLRVCGRGTVRERELLQNTCRGHSHTPATTSGRPISRRCSWPPVSPRSRTRRPTGRPRGTGQLPGTRSHAKVQDTKPLQEQAVPVPPSR